MLIDTPPAALTGQLWMLGTRPYPLYLWRNAGQAAIFEGGTGAMAAVVGRQLAELGVPAGEVRQLVITHAHPDHVMAVPRLKEAFPSLRVTASAIAKATLGVEKAVGFFDKMDQGLSEWLVSAGAVQATDRPGPLAQRRIDVDEVVGEGDRLEIAGTVFQVLATPGHSDCSLSFFQPDQRVLLISDATGYYMPQAGTWWPNYFSKYADYMGSMERLARLDAEVLCLSHNGAICGAEAVRKYFDGAIETTRKYHERIVAEARQGRAPREIAEQLGVEVHQQVGRMPLDFFQKNCGILVKLSLAEEGIGQ